MSDPISRRKLSLLATSVAGASLLPRRSAAASSDLLIATCSWTLGIDDLDEMMAAIADADLNAVQYCQPTEDYEPEHVLRSAADHGLTVIAYDPFDCRPPSDSKATREGALAFYQKAVDYAQALGVPATIHGLTTWTVQESSDEAQWAMLVDLCDHMVAYAAQRNVDVLFEPCNLYEIPLVHSASDYETLVRRMTHGGRLGYLPDAFHMNIHETDAVGVLERLAGRTGIYHISDSNREGIGRGTVDFRSHHDALMAGGFRGPVAVEAVLASNPVNTSPRNGRELRALQDQLRTSARIWRSYGPDAE